MNPTGWPPRRAGVGSAAIMEHGMASITNDFYETIEPRLHRQIASALKSAQRIVDLGCGHCRLAGFLAEQNDHRHVIGIDVADRGFPRDGEFGGRLRCVRADARDLAFLGSNTVDAVVSLYALHELGAPVASLREARRLLRRGGEVLVVDFPRGSLAQRLWNEPYHSTGEVADLLRRAGFVKVRARRTACRQLTWARAFKPDTRRGAR